MHVEGQRGRAAPPAQLGREEAIGGEIGAEPAMLLRHAQREQTGRAQIGVILERKTRLAVVDRGARAKAFAAELFGDRHQLSLPRGRVEGAHALALRPASMP